MSSLHLQFERKLQLLILCAEAFFGEHKPYLQDEMNFFIYFCRAIPKRLKDKLVSYILVLALMIDEYTLECSVIMKDLGMSDSRYETNIGYWKRGK